MTILTPQKSFSINSDIEEWEAFEKKSVISPADIEKASNSLFLTLRFNKHLNLKASTEKLSELVHAANLFEHNSQGHSALSLALRYHKDHNLNLSAKTWGYLIDNSNTEHRTEKGRNAFMLYCYHNKRQELNFSVELVDKLLRHTKPYEVDALGDTNFGLAVSQYHREELYFNEAHWDKLLKTVSPQEGIEEYLRQDSFLVALKYRGLDSVPLNFSHMLILEKMCGYYESDKYEKLMKVEKAATHKGYSEYLQEKAITQERIHLNDLVASVPTVDKRLSGKSLKNTESNMRHKI